MYAASPEKLIFHSGGGGGGGGGGSGDPPLADIVLALFRPVSGLFVK